MTCFVAIFFIFLTNFGMSLPYGVFVIMTSQVSVGRLNMSVSHIAGSYMFSITFVYPFFFKTFTIEPSLLLQGSKIVVSLSNLILSNNCWVIEKGVRYLSYTFLNSCFFCGQIINLPKEKKRFLLIHYRFSFYANILIVRSQISFIHSLISKLLLQ